MRTLLLLAVIAVLAVPADRALAQAATQPAAATAPAGAAIDPAVAAQVDSLRDQLKAAYGRGDVAGMLKFLHPQVVIVFPDGEVLEGRDALAGYYDRMLKGPDHVVQSYTSDPVVTQRYVHGDSVVSYGRMNDHYVLTDGSRFGLDSRFTVTALRLPDGPPETGGWMIRSFHSSTDAFENAVLGMAVRKVMWLAGGSALFVGALLGAALALLLRKRRRSAGAGVGAGAAT